MRRVWFILLFSLCLKAQNFVDIAAIDKKADPCVDFYQYACGGWLAAHPLEPDQSRFGRFTELGDRNQAVLRTILEKAADTSNTKRDQIERQIGEYYAACMDEKTIESEGAKPIQADLERILAITDKKGVAGVVAWLKIKGINAFFGFGSGPDAKDSKREIANVQQGGLTLPDRDYYLKTDAKSTALRVAFAEHVQRMFALLGDSTEKAQAAAQAVMNIETALAKSSLDRVALRTPGNRYHKLPVTDLDKLAPGFDWKVYFQALGLVSFDALNISVPTFVQGLGGVLETSSLDDLKTYLTWHLLNQAAPLLPKAFADEDFEFTGKTLTGVTEQRPRWKRCAQNTDRALGDAVGRKYVEVAFSEAAKERTLKMVAEIEKQMGKDVTSLTWMSAATKDQALTKLNLVANKIGFPDKWKDYGSVSLTRTQALGNSWRANAYAVRRNLDKIGKPVDRSEWNMSPPTVNAYYSPPNNDINFPAGILQAPFYNPKADEAVNYGAIGSVVGHELTHGFDDQGRQYDGNGNLRDWWSVSDGEEFKKRADCIVDEYSGFTVAGDVHLNGRLTLGENSADNGGIRLAYMAMMESVTDKTPVAGYTPSQRFFLGFAQIWCENSREQNSRLRAQTDPHSPGRYRTNGVVQNMPEFAEAFSCKVGQPMRKENACRVW